MVNTWLRVYKNCDATADTSPFGYIQIRSQVPQLVLLQRWNCMYIQLILHININMCLNQSKYSFNREKVDGAVYIVEKKDKE